MKSKSILVMMLVSLFATISIVPMAYAQVPVPGPKTDVLRGLVIRSPDAQLIAMQTDVADVAEGQIRTADIEKMVGDGLTMTADLGFHMGYIAYNIRDDQSYRGGDRADYDGVTKKWPLADVEFRHALIHGYDQLGIIPPLYGYIVTPVRSLVPPAQSYWYNPAVPEHAFNIGDVDTSPAGEHSTVGLLKAAGYSFVDADSSGPGVTDADYWNDPDGNPLPRMLIWTPLLEIAPTSYQHGQEFTADLGTIGLKATPANGDHGMVAEGADFNWYLTQVFDFSNFDGFMVFWGLGTIADQVYLFCHSSQDTLVVPGSYNAPGINDPILDAQLEQFLFTLPPPPGQPDPRQEAAFEVQEMLYNPDLPNADNFALAYMLLYSRTYFNAFTEGLDGIVKSPGFSSDNGATWMNARWNASRETPRTEDGRTVINYILGEKIEGLNPLYNIIWVEVFFWSSTLNGLIGVNPYNHADRPVIATDWSLELTGDPAAPMKIHYTIRSDITWQDGRPYTADDAAFNLLFIRDWQIPIHSSIWPFIVDVVVNSPTSFTVTVSETNWVLLYDLAGIAAKLPPQVWDREWADLQAIIDYDPTEPYNVAPGYSAGPHPPPTNLFGTGPWIFQFYDDAAQFGDLWANRNYWRTDQEFDDALTEWFHAVGDVNTDGVNNAFDHNAISAAFGTPGTAPDYPEDVNSDGIVDTFDDAIYSFHIGWQKELP